MRLGWSLQEADVTHLEDEREGGTEATGLFSAWLLERWYRVMDGESPFRGQGEKAVPLTVSLSPPPPAPSASLRLVSR